MVTVAECNSIFHGSDSSAPHPLGLNMAIQRGFSKLWLVLAMVRRAMWTKDASCFGGMFSHDHIGHVIFCVSRMLYGDICAVLEGQFA